MSEFKSVSEVEKAIAALISKGVALADETGETFSVGDEEYIPVSSDEFEDYKWIRDEHYLPHDQGLWYSSSMNQC